MVEGILKQEEAPNESVASNEGKVVEEKAVAKPKRQRKAETHVSEAKKKLVKDLVELMKKKTIMIVSIKNLPDAQFQSLKKRLRGKAFVKVVKKSLIDFALEHAKNPELEKLVKFVDADFAILFSDEDAFELSGFLADNKNPARAKIGQEALEDIEIKAGPTELLPGPDISALSSVGLVPKVENGKISIMQDKILVKKGQAISEAQASILAKLDITPFEVGLEPLAAYSDGKIYVDIKIDKEATLQELIDAAGRGIAFAVSVDYMNDDTITFILGKAAAHEGALDSLMKEEAPAEEKAEEVKDEPKAEGASGEKPVEEVKEDVQETKAEEKKDES